MQVVKKKLDTPSLPCHIKLLYQSTHWTFPQKLSTMEDWQWQYVINSHNLAQSLHLAEYKGYWIELSAHICPEGVWVRPFFPSLFPSLFHFLSLNEHSETDGATTAVLIPTNQPLGPVPGQNSHTPPQPSLHTYHNGVVWEQGTDRLHKLHKMLWIAICHIQANVPDRWNGLQNTC